MRFAPGSLQEVGDELGGNRLAGAALLFLLGIAVIRDDGGNAGGGGALDGVDHDEELHQLWS